VNEAAAVRLACSIQADSQPGASRVSHAIGHQAYKSAADLAAPMQLCAATARCMMALLSWCELGRSLAMPGLIHDTKFQKNEASTWEMGKLLWTKYSTSDLSIVPGHNLGRRSINVSS
jgi:hypothetical protein